MGDIVFKALECIKENPEYICKYLTPNDTGENGSHQSGIYINKADGRRLFRKSFKKGENVHSDILIRWFDTNFENHCKFIYYGKGRRKDEFRITCLNRKLKSNDFFLLVKVEEEFIGFIFDNSQATVLLTKMRDIHTA